MSWSTPAEASALTGLTIVQSELDVAQGILEIWTSVIDDDRIENMRSLDVTYLKKAEAYQAAWMQTKPAYFERSDVDQVIQDSLQFNKGDQDTHVLAPLAKACIMKLSWTGARTIDPLTAEQALIIRRKHHAETYGKQTHGPLTEDEIYPWEPM